MIRRLYGIKLHFYKVLLRGFMPASYDLRQWRILLRHKLFYCAFWSGFCDLTIGTDYIFFVQRGAQNVNT